MPSSRVMSTGFVPVALVVVAACSPGSSLGPSSGPPDNPLGDACEGEPPREPDLMGWKASERASLGALRRKGVVAVRYEAEGCDVSLEVLPNCIGEGGYEFSPYVATESKLAHDVGELRAELPLGAAELAGRLKQGWSLRTDYQLAGVLSLPVGKRYEREALTGFDCDRATHVVARIYLGGFALAVGESRTIEAAVTIFGAGLSGGQLKQSERLASEGDAESCQIAQKQSREHDACSVPLRVGLLPLGSPFEKHDPLSGPPPLVVMDEHGCNQTWQVWNGERCVSVQEKRKECPKGQFYNENTEQCMACHPKILARGCP